MVLPPTAESRHDDNSGALGGTEPLMDLGIAIDESHEGERADVLRCSGRTAVVGHASGVEEFPGPEAVVHRLHFRGLLSVRMAE